MEGCVGVGTVPMRCVTCEPCSAAGRTSGMSTGIRPMLNRRYPHRSATRPRQHSPVKCISARVGGLDEPGNRVRLGYQASLSNHQRYRNPAPRKMPWADAQGIVVWSLPDEDQTLYVGS